jgi:hypothetical protein
MFCELRHCAQIRGKIEKSLTTQPETERNNPNFIMNVRGAMNCETTNATTPRILFIYSMFHYRKDSTKFD